MPQANLIRYKTIEPITTWSRAFSRACHRFLVFRFPFSLLYSFVLEQCFNVKRFIATTSVWFIDSQHLNPLTFLFFRAFLQWQVVTGMEAENIIESLANYIWFLRVPNAICTSHLFLINRRTPVDLWRHNVLFWLHLTEKN